MTNINCSENCIYQKDGKCSFENINVKRITPNHDCAYYMKPPSSFVCTPKGNPL